jgi:hypothetical protein
MRRRFSMGVLATLLAITGRLSLADTNWTSCVTAPTRGCSAWTHLPNAAHNSPIVSGMRRTGAPANRRSVPADAAGGA